MCIRSARPICTALFLFLLCTGFSFGWLNGSFGCADTHGTLAGRSIQENRLDQARFPDLWRFRDDLIDGSRSEDGHPNPSANGAEGGDLTTDWNVVQERYFDEDFHGAYHRLGIMGHLIQDQALPSHAFDIQHIAYRPNWLWPSRTRAFVHGDHFEKYAGQQELLTADPVGFIVFPDPTVAYDRMIRDTRSVVNRNVDAPDLWPGPIPDAQANGTNGWTAYWTDCDPKDIFVFAPPLVVGTFTFNGEFGVNSFPDKVTAPANRAEARRLHPTEWYDRYYTPFMNSRASRAILHTAGCWAVASQKLPPLIRNATAVGGRTVVRDLDQGGPLGAAGPVHVEFDVFENRTARLARVKVQLDGIDIPPYPRESVELQVEPSASRLPWKIHFAADSDRPGNEVAIDVLDEDGNGTIVTIPVTSGR